MINKDNSLSVATNNIFITYFTDIMTYFYKTIVTSYKFISRVLINQLSLKYGPLQRVI